MSENAIDVDNISKTFKIFHEKRETLFETISGWLNKKKYSERLNVLKNVSFSVKQGEMFGIVGKNGMGKTTLLRVLAGIYQPDSGKVTINGKMAS